MRFYVVTESERESAGAFLTQSEGRFICGNSSLVHLLFSHTCPESEGAPGSIANHLPLNRDEYTQARARSIPPFVVQSLTTA